MLPLLGSTKNASIHENADQQTCLFVFLIFFLAACVVLCLWQNGVENKPVFYPLLNCIRSTKGLHLVTAFCLFLLPLSSE